MPWQIKYKPKNLKEFVNQKQAIEAFLNWIAEWKPGSKALLFYGPSGVGKTALVEAYAMENDLNLIQLNASDYRSAAKIKEVLGQSMKQKSLFKKGKIFIIDEIDRLVGKEDRGGVGEIIKIIKGSFFPCILTANHPYEAKLRNLRKYCKLVEFKKIPVKEIEKRLEEICEKEKIKAEEAIKELAKRAEGDLRSAINDLETISQGKKEIKLNDLEALGYRERETNIFNILKNIFKSTSVLDAKLSIKSSDKDPDEIFWWIENNITREYEGAEEIATAFDALSKADIFKQRIRVRQNWRFLSYMIDMMTGGVAVAKLKRDEMKQAVVEQEVKEIKEVLVRYKYPRMIAILGHTKRMRAEEKVRLLELSKLLHCSVKKMRSEFLPYLKILTKKNRKLYKKFPI